MVFNQKGGLSLSIGASYRHHMAMEYTVQVQAQTSEAVNACLALVLTKCYGCKYLTGGFELIYSPSPLLPELRKFCEGAVFVDAQSHLIAK